VAPGGGLLLLGGLEHIFTWRRLGSARW